jgi:dTDP-4-dehydrorhamnose 3,5-epimerase
MRFLELPLPGAWVIEIETLEDDRGHFGRSFCREEFRARGLRDEVLQSNVSYNRRRGTLRGMHFQVAPHEEAKLVRCTRGALYDVIVDLRPGSPARGQWQAVELTSDNYRMLYIPEGFAHGFQTLEDGTEASYLMFHSYHPESARGFRWNDPTLAIDWPLPVTAISLKDLSLPTLL